MGGIQLCGGYLWRVRALALAVDLPGAWAGRLALRSVFQSGLDYPHPPHSALPWHSHPSLPAVGHRRAH